MEPAEPRSPVEMQTLQAAEQLRLRREAERASLTKSQLKKTRRKLSRLYHKAQGDNQASESQPGTSISEAAPSEGEPLGQAWPACASESICAEPTEDGTIENSYQAVPTSAADTATVAQGPMLASDVTSPGKQASHGQAKPTAHHHPEPLWPPAGQQQQQPATVLSQLPACGSKPQLPPHPARPLPPAGRGRHMDMSRVMQVLHGQLKSRDTPQAPGSHLQVHAATSGHLTQVVSTQQPQAGSSSGALEAAGKDKPGSGAPRQQQQQKPSSKQKQFIYGNYHGYYGYRYANMDAFRDDPRLALLQPDWFAGRHMLDVGCNEGLVTLAVATHLGCASATGVDIDQALITKAARNLRNLRSSVTEQLKVGPTSGGGGRGRRQTGSRQESVITSVEECDLEDGASHASHGSFGAPPAAASAPPPEAGQVAVQQVQVHSSSAVHIKSRDEQQQAHRVVGQQLQQEVVMQQVVVQGVPEAAGVVVPVRVAGGTTSNAAAPSATGQQPGGDVTKSGALQQHQQQAGRSGGRQVCAPTHEGTPPSGYGSWSALRTAARALSNVQFLHQDWANQDQPEPIKPQGSARTGAQPNPPRVRTRFGVIMCLSVTKWVHINWGDEGLLRLFSRFQSSLEPGGYLVLEPQPWRSYQAAGRKYSSGLKGSQELVARLTIRPEGFVRLLTQDYGFELLADLNKSSSAVGFDRPMYVFRQTGGAPSPAPGGTASLSLTALPQGSAGRAAAALPSSKAGGSQQPRSSYQKRARSGSVGQGGAGSAGVGGGYRSVSQGVSQGSVGSSRKRHRSAGLSRRHQRQSRPEDLLVIEDQQDGMDEGEEAAQQ